MITYSKLTKRNIIIKYNNNPVLFASRHNPFLSCKVQELSQKHSRFWATPPKWARFYRVIDEHAVRLTGQFGSLVFVSLRSGFHGNEYTMAAASLATQPWPSHRIDTSLDTLTPSLARADTDAIANSGFT